MSSLQALERFLADPPTPRACPTEADYYALWHAMECARLPATDMAISGALAADRLAWVFAAGYQACLRHAFGALLPATGWAAFIATEDQHDPARHPGTTLAADAGAMVLNGHKSWVAHAALVDHLIVTINDAGGDKRSARGVVLPRDRTGISLRLREQPGFLAAMSQGYAQFEDTPVDGAEIFEFEPIRQFGRTEAKFVMLAACAFMLRQSHHGEPLCEQLFAVAVALVALLGEADTSRQVYARIETVFQRCVDTFEHGPAPAAIPGYAEDCRLFRMYSARIQRRAGYARDEAAARA